METKELIQALRLDAEWAHANEWETPIMLGDHLDAAADALEALLAEVGRLNSENEAMQSIVRHAEELDEQLAAVTAERDAAVNDLRGKCQYCARQPMRRLSDGQLDALCATCQEYNKCNWKYRGARKENDYGN